MIPERRGDLQKHGGFSDPRFSCEKHHRAVDEAPAEDPVKLAAPPEERM